MVGGSVSTVRFIRCPSCKFLLTEFDGIPLPSCSECGKSLQDKEEPSNFDTRSVGSWDDIVEEQTSKSQAKGNSNLRSPLQHANRTTGLSRRTFRSRTASRELEEGINTKMSLNFETKPRGSIPESSLSSNNFGQCTPERAMSVYSDDILSDDHRMGSEISTSFRSHSSSEKVLYEDKAIDQNAEFSTLGDQLHKPVTQTDRLHVPRYHGRERTRWMGTPELKEDSFFNNPKGGRQIPCNHSPLLSYSSGSSPTSCHSGSPYMGTNFRRKERPTTEKRYTRPFLGGSNYVVCTHCSALLEIPRQFQFLKGGTIKFRCGRDSCSEIISYTILDDNHTEHFQDSLAAEELDEIFSRSDTMWSETESTGKGDKGTPLSSLHRLMGYFSARDILYDQSFRR